MIQKLFQSRQGVDAEADVQTAGLYSLLSETKSQDQHDESN